MYLQTRAVYMKSSDTCASLNSDGVHQRQINSKALFLDLSFILGVMKRAKLRDLWPINSKAQMRCSWNGCDMWYIRRGLFSTEFLFNVALPHWQKLFLELIGGEVRVDGAFQGPDLWRVSQLSFISWATRSTQLLEWFGFRPVYTCVVLYPWRTVILVCGSRTSLLKSKTVE